MEEEESSVSAERVNGLSIVEKKMRGTMQFLAVEVEAGEGMLLVASAAGAELTNLARAMREAKKVLVCITFSIYIFLLLHGVRESIERKKKDRRTSEHWS